MWESLLFPWLPGSPFAALAPEPCKPIWCGLSIWLVVTHPSTILLEGSYSTGGTQIVVGHLHVNTETQGLRLCSILKGSAAHRSLCVCAYECAVHVCVACSNTSKTWSCQITGNVLIQFHSVVPNCILSLDEFLHNQKFNHCWMNHWIVYLIDVWENVLKANNIFCKLSHINILARHLLRLTDREVHWRAKSSIVSAAPQRGTRDPWAMARFHRRSALNHAT